MELDSDLLSIQQARNLVRSARQAQNILAQFDQAQVDRVVESMAVAGRASAERLARLAVEETGFGVYQDKVTKNLFAAGKVYDYIKGLKTVGIIAQRPEEGILEIAEPVGVIAGITPSTNPTSTVIYKSLISLKARNSIVFSPHPAAVKCSAEAARLMDEAAVTAGAPEGVIGCITTPTLKGTHELMHHPDVALILATGGTALVRAAYSSGKPAYGVGPGNVPAFIERTAEVRKAVKDILTSKTFDHGTICASEQAIVVDEPVKEQVLNELRNQGGYWLSPAEIKALGAVVVLPTGGLNPAIVGQSPQTIASLAGITIPPHARVLVAELEGVGKSYPLSMEKLSPILAFYTEKDWEAACRRCIEILKYGGLGHTLVIHSRNEQVIREFALKKPAFRILVNTPASHGAIGATTGLAPALTLGCGTWGGSSTADNLTPLHLLNLKRAAYGLREVTSGPIEAGGPSVSREQVASIVREVLAKLGRA